MARFRDRPTGLSLAGLLLILVTNVGCGNGGDGSDTIDPLFCAGLGDPEVSCTFEGQFVTPFGEMEASLTVFSFSEPGSFQMELGPRRRAPQYSFWAPRGATETTFAGDVQLLVVGGDLPFEGVIQVDLLDNGSSLRFVFLSGDILSDDSVFEGIYAGP